MTQTILEKTLEANPHTEDDVRRTVKYYELRFDKEPDVQTYVLGAKEAVSLASFESGNGFESDLECKLAHVSEIPAKNPKFFDRRDYLLRVAFEGSDFAELDSFAMLSSDSIVCSRYLESQVLDGGFFTGCYWGGQFSAKRTRSNFSFAKNSVLEYYPNAQITDSFIEKASTGIGETWYPQICFRVSADSHDIKSIKKLFWDSLPQNGNAFVSDIQTAKIVISELAALQKQYGVYRDE